MHLKKLQLFGFKSFASKTEFVFEPGVTAIVGPNGCGKSNIVDAIKWVLGEQSAKSLRGLRMEDVIFNGTVDKEPVNFAEVSLTLSNHSKILPIDYEEVTIARRLFRSGESEYLLNKTPVRLKDIAELLMDTGIGLDNYFLMEQGKIDLVLSSKPEERRAIFEEASGITKYKSKKREALNKLQQAEANLLRINDIISEVQRQLNSIERQAAKARRYQKHFERLKDLELKVCGTEHEDLEKQRIKIEEEIQKAKQHKTQLATDAQAFSAQLKTGRQELEDVDELMSQMRNDSQELENTIFRDRERIQLDKERIQESKATIVDLTGHLESNTTKMADLKKQIDELSKEKESFLTEKDSKVKILQEKEDSLACLKKSIEEAQQAITHSKAEIFERTAGLSKAKNELARATANIAAASNRLRRLNMEKQGCVENLNAAKARLEEAESQLQVQRGKVEGLRFEMGNLDAKFKKAQQDLAALNKQYDCVQKDLVVVQSKLVLLQDIAEKHSGFSDSVNAFLSDPGIKDKPWHKDIHGVLTDLIACSKDKSEVSSLSEKLQILTNEKQKNDQVVSEFSAELELLNEQILKEEIELANRQTSKAHADEEFAKLKEELSVIELELDDLSEESERLKAQDESLKSQIAGLENDLSQSEQSVTSNQEWIQVNLKEKEAVLVEIAKTKAELASVSEREDNLNSSLRILVESSDRESALYQARTKQIDDSKARITALQQEIQQLSSELETLASKKDSIEKNLANISGDKKALLDKISEKEIEFEKLQKDLQHAGSQVYSLETQAAQISFQQERLKDRVSQTYKVDLGSYKLLVQRDTELPQAEPEFNTESARIEIDELRAKLDSIGPVNLAAVGEEKELQERFSFMIGQRDDLLKAKESLLEAIAKINKTTKEMFLDTFNKVQEEFKTFFKLLFGGGDTELFLVDEHDVLESGIEIVARPPGKRLQNISLLSGGERAMIALALLFAVFKVKPSPFCIMDEIDAPLDEANIDRFSRVLQDFTKNSQFIIVTHNKKTITTTDVMYGITMEESGISKVVSVKFAEKEEEETVIVP